MAERFVKTMKEDYIAFMPKPNVRTALHNLAVAIEHYNENHPHSALGDAYIITLNFDLECGLNLILNVALAWILCPILVALFYL